MAADLSIRVTRFLHSRWMLLTMAVVTVACGAIWMATGNEAGFSGDRGLLFPSANLWFGDALMSGIVNIALTLTLALMMITLNRTYTLQRTATLLDGTMFLAMSVATPRVLCAVNTGTVLALTIITCLYILYGNYGDLTRRVGIYIVFLMLSALTMTQYCFALYIPVFILGIVQMRIFNFKALAAILLGLATPWWLVLASGIAQPSDVHLPSFADIFSTFSIGDSLGYLLTVGVTVLTFITAWILNVPRLIAYNAHKRAYNGMLTVMSFMTVLAVCLDYINAMVYITVLYMSAAFQVSNIFEARRKGGYLTILMIIVLYLAIYVCKILHLHL